MRIPTAQLFQNSIQSMLKQHEALQHTQLQLSTGLRILKPSDDPAGSVKVLNLSTNIGMVEQFDRNAAIAQAELSQQESVLDTMNETLQRVRELSIQGMNPTNHDTARQGIALEIEERFKELLSLANSRDTNGEYLFAGAKSQQLPFVNSSGTVTYGGDQTLRELTIGDGASVVTRDSGEQLFMKVPSGDGTVQAQAGVSNTGTMAVGQYSTNGSFVPGTYTVTFNAGAYSVSDGSTTIASGSYVDGESIQFAGVNVALSGKPANGDTMVVKPSQNVSLFSVVQGIASALRITTGDSGNRAGVMNKLSQGLANLDQAMLVVNNQQASVGARLNNVESIGGINEDYKLQLDTLKSSTQDLDFAEAITRFNQQLTSLQAAQQTYSKTADLSLFRYL
jgi:flagellar hook-associated protein 3 FlgL